MKHAIRPFPHPFIIMNPPSLPTLPPRYFTKPVLLAGAKTHYLALPTGTVQDQFYQLATRYTLVRCNEHGERLPRERRGKKMARVHRKLAHLAAAAKPELN